MSRHLYPVEACRVFQRTTTAKLQASLTSQCIPDVNEASEVSAGMNNAPDMPKEMQENLKSGKSSEPKKNTNEGSHAKQSTLKSVIGEALGYGTSLSEHILLDAGLTPNTKLHKNCKIDEHMIHMLDEAVTKFEDWLEEIISGARIPEGYILMQNKNFRKVEDLISKMGTDVKVYDEFCPMIPNQFKSRETMKFETFDAALDEFYSKIESQRSEQQQKAKVGSAMQKLDKIRVDQENRVSSLRKEVEHSVKMAELIEYNLEDVDAAVLAVRAALANGMSWEDLGRMVKDEAKSGNPVAGLIDRLHLEKNCITLLLSNNLDEMDDDEKTLPVEKVAVDLALSAHANARRWYELKKRHESKQEKTISAHEKAFKAVEKKTRFQLSQEKSVATISHIRKVHWFEKFNWFISSENYLIISGRDAQQNEIIVKRHMSKGDLYVHADLHGASSTIIKNHKPNHPIPPLTLNQAGCFTVCHSQAWDSKIVTSAWWVYPHQVSKSAPTGEYLTVGSFMIRGKKNFLPPHPLIMGFGMLFRLDESSLAPHVNERRVRGEEEEMDDIEESESLKELPDSDSEKEATNENIRKQLITSPDSSMENHELASLATNGLTASHSSADSRDEISNGDKNTLDGARPQLEDLIDRALELGSTKRHGLENMLLDMHEDHDHEERKGAVREKPYISKAERRRLKKGQRSNTPDETVDGVEEYSSASTFQDDKSVPNLGPAAGKINRGQRSKLKKMKEKYQDQDEEERNIRMTLLASSGKVRKDDGELQSRSATTEKEVKPASALEDTLKVCYKCKKAGHLSRDCRGPDETLNSRAGVDGVLIEEDDIHEIGEQEREKLNEMDYLTGNPLPNDILLYAVPVCGPYAALQTYKYRVKIVPGTAKKGKAAKTALNLFGHMAEATSREKEVMKACTDPEMCAAIIGNVKITAAGLTQLKQKQKQGKKTSKNAR